MSTYTKLKSITRRSSMLGAAVALLVAAFAPASLTYADALNPLTHRSLTLSTSAPGWDFTDGSGNSTYAPPNSGANGKKTGNTFAFNVSTNSTNAGINPTNAPIKAFTFQYCTSSAGNCRAPGNNGQSSGTRLADDVAGKKSDLVVATSSPTEISSGKFTSSFDATAGVPTSVPNPNDSEGNFVVLTKNVGDATWSYNGGWTMAASNVESGGSIAADTKTGRNNYITLTNSTGFALANDGAVKVIFFGTNGNYVTNPGSGAFFVKINDYNSASTLNDTTLVDGGVTVANVVNQSIQITTKVLETMDFSVGTVDPYTLVSDGTTGSELYAANGNTRHGQCDRVLTGLTPAASANTLQLGDTAAENSLRTDKTFSTHSYWRLSSNSSAGATVYYSGVTLKNTVGDQIQGIGTTAQAPVRGTPQFGLALANGTSGPYTLNYGTEQTVGQVYENAADNGRTGVDSSTGTDITFQGLAGYHTPKLAPLAPTAAYTQGAGNVNSEYGTVNTQFAFDTNSNTIPAALATENASVVDCVTGKVRYIANIAATTPAGIYTTKINYIAAPQY